MDDFWVCCLAVCGVCFAVTGDDLSTAFLVAPNSKTKAQRSTDGEGLTAASGPETLTLSGKLEHRCRVL